MSSPDEARLSSEERQVVKMQDFAEPDLCSYDSAEGGVGGSVALTSPSPKISQ
jgi:hypothetical protein